MAHVTEHPFRVKRRKLDDDPPRNEESLITSSAQLREVLLFQQNAQTANKGELVHSPRLSTSLSGH